jgi:hypothetical protein
MSISSYSELSPRKRTLKRKSQHPADADALASIGRARAFTASLFLGTGKFAHSPESPTLVGARHWGALLQQRHGGRRRALIYALLPNGRSVHIPERAAGKAVKAAKPAKASKEKKAKPLGKRAAIEAAAAEGKLPAPPDFAAATHARYRGKLAEVVAMAQAGDIKGLKAYPINPISTSPKAIDRYRNLCITALKAREVRAA